MADSLEIVIIGLSITSSWGNGHATTYRGLVRELERRGHNVTFLENDPTGVLWAMLGIPTGTGKAGALLADATGKLVAVLPTVSSVEDFRAQLVKLRR